MSFKANVKTQGNTYFHMHEQYDLLWIGSQGYNAFQLDPGQALQIASLLRGWA
jgi:hypothetical protein